MYEPSEFLWHEGEKDIWGRGKNILISAIKDEVTEDLNETINCMMTWIENSDVFQYGDFPKSGMCNMPNPDGAFDKALGIAQQYSRD